MRLLESDGWGCWSNAGLGFAVDDEVVDMVLNQISNQSQIRTNQSMAAHAVTCLADGLELLLQKTCCIYQFLQLLPLAPSL